MGVRVAINGFGRIGRNVLRAIAESGRKDIEVVGINDLGPVETNAHLLRFDSVHGRFPRSEEHTSELQSQFHLVCRLLLEKKKKIQQIYSELRTKKYKTNNKITHTTT